ncbi:MAG: 1-deoxy-D-xylulose-5-phosphate synthase, partial [Congregibacter sp.]|nr:1-deoxy-D-xylulose-5-phosphate synthase [Congregibacter sp.]
MFDELPTTRPITPALDKIDQGIKLSALSEEELLALPDELRSYLLFSAGQTGGHFGAGLGVVELTIA